MQRVIKQGHIDPEDFNGVSVYGCLFVDRGAAADVVAGKDPEWNVPGKRGIRPTVRKRKVDEEDDEEKEEACLAI